jgi:glyoxalase family protein
LTFFPWVGAAGGRSGAGQTGVISLAIPQAALGYWLERFTRLGVPHESPILRFDQQAVAFRDPDGLMLELVAEAQPDDRPGWEGGSVPLENAIRGTHAVTLWEESNAHTARLITEIMGFRLLGREGNFYRYAVGDGAPGALVEVREMPRFWRAAGGTGTVHHVAWRTPDDAQQLAWRRELLNVGSQVTTVQDRTYFHSIYYREPGGVLFEIATDPPGFAIDESVSELGTHLRLPPWLEPQRTLIERALPPIHLPQAQPEL